MSTETVQVDALVGKIGVPTHDKRTINDLLIITGDTPIPVRLPDGALAAATAQITASGVVARLTVPPDWAERLLRGGLHAHMDVDAETMSTNTEGGAIVLYGCRLRAITLTDAPAAWDGTWVAPVRPPQPATPELDKMVKARDEGHSEDIGAFLEWLESRGLHLARWSAAGDQLVLADTPINRLLAAYFEVDLDVVEQERRALLEYLRERS